MSRRDKLIFMIEVRYIVIANTPETVRHKIQNVPQNKKFMVHKVFYYSRLRLIRTNSL